MAAGLNRCVPNCFRVLAVSRQFTVGAKLSAKDQSLEDPVKKLFLEKIKVAAIYAYSNFFTYG